MALQQKTTKSQFTDIVVIYNPNSTGNGKSLAADLKKSLKAYPVKLVATEHAGHAEELAYEFAKTSKYPLILSSSGDGGYHEVVNGLLRAQNEGATPVAGLLPAGNANDHYHDVHDIDLVETIMKAKVKQIDVLKITATSDRKKFERYAHSYIGFGLTPKVGKELNKVDLNWFNEIVLALKALFTLRPIKVRVNNKTRTYDSLIFSNIAKMSKVLTLSKDASHDDGKFEVTVFKRRNKLQLIKVLIRASTTGLTGSEQSEPYNFKTIKQILVQVDGEVSTIDADSTVTVSLSHKALNCII